jgi:phage-related protein
MPATEIRAFRDIDKAVPVKEWLDDLERREPKVYAKCLARILELAAKGNEMRRPHADYLRDGIYELRATVSRVHYRLLYFYYGKNVVALSHGITKEGRVPPAEIDRAIERMELVKGNPDRYTADFEISE